MRSLGTFRAVFWLAAAFSTTSVSIAEEPPSKPPPAEARCIADERELSSRKTTLSTVKASLDSLLNGGTAFDLPLSVLFQIDLRDSNQVAKRIVELGKLESTEAIAKNPEFEKYSSCPDGPQRGLVADVISLQSQINKIKLLFLRGSAENRKALATAYLAARSDIENQAGLSSERDISKAALDSAHTALAKSEEESVNASDDPPLLARSAIENYMVDLESEHIAFIDAINEKKLSLDSLQASLSRVPRVESSQDAEAVGAAYKEVNGIWGSTADRLIDLFFKSKLQTETSPPPTGFAVSENDENFQNALNKAKESYQGRSLSKNKWLSDLKVQNFRILQDAGTLRAALLEKCDELSCKRARGISEENIRTLVREIRIVPARFIAGGLSRWREVQSKAGAGFDGLLDLTKQGGILLFLLLIPFIFVKTLKWTTEWLERTKKRILSRSMIDYRRRTSLAMWITRLNPFIPSVGMILSIAFARGIIADTALKEIAVFLFYLQIFFIYRALRLLLKVTLEIVFATGSVDGLKEQQGRIERSTKRISILLFVEYVLLHLTEDAVRKALAYNLFYNIISLINIAFLIYESAQWRIEISASFRSRFPALWERVQGFYQHSLGKLFLPLMFVAIVLNDLALLFWRYFSKLDFVKRALSEVLRKRLERDEKESKERGTPPAEYLRSFDYYLAASDTLYVDRESSAVATAVLVISGWDQRKKSDDLIIIVGDRGMGKTTTLDRIEKNLRNQLETVFSKVPIRTLSSADLFAWLSRVLNSQITSVEDFVAYDRSRSKKLLICLDDVQNLFIGVIGGFEAYRTFAEIISLKTQNFFWCLTINSSSWAYIKGVVGKEHFYGKVMPLSPWQDFEIQKLIQNRHDESGFSREFDESIKAYGAGDGLGQQAEAQFFRLLWGQSRGNPRSALMYWVSAISSPANKSIHVGVPSFISSALVDSMSDDSLFILSALARHENLSREEIHLVTNIPDSVIRKCLKEAHDKALIWTDEVERVRISSRAQYVIDYYLIGKNFLYE